MAEVGIFEKNLLPISFYTVPPDSTEIFLVDGNWWQTKVNNGIVVTVQMLRDEMNAGADTVFSDFSATVPAGATGINFDSKLTNYNTKSGRTGKPFCPTLGSLWFVCFTVDGVTLAPTYFESTYITYGFLCNPMSLPSPFVYTLVAFESINPAVLFPDTTVVYMYEGRGDTIYVPSSTKPRAEGTYTLSYAGTNSGFFYCSTPIQFELILTPTTITIYNDTTLTYNTLNRFLEYGDDKRPGYTTAPVSLPVSLVYFEYVNGQINRVYEVKNAGRYRVSIFINDYRYRNSLTVFDLTIQKYTPRISPNQVTASITYGQTLASAIFPYEGVWVTDYVSGSFTFDVPTIMPSVGASYAATFYPTDTSNYNNSASTTVPVTVNKATPTITAIAADITYGQTLASSSLLSSSASAIVNGVQVNVPGVFTFTSPGTQPALGSSQHGIIFKPTNTSNYNNVEGQLVSVRVIQAPATITVNNTRQPYKNANYVLEYGNGTGLTYTTDPPNLAASIAYYSGHGITTNPPQVTMKALGNYTCAITITNPNYIGLKRENFTIEPGNVELTLTDRSQQYTGTVLSVGPSTKLTNSETDTISYTYSGAYTTPQNVATYTVTATGYSGNYTYTITPADGNTLTITPAPATITVNDPTGTRLTQTYASVTLLTTNDALIVATPTLTGAIVTYIYKNINNATVNPTEVGMYTVTASANNANYTYSMNQVTTLEITKKSISYSLSPLQATYTGKYLSTFVTYTPNSNVPWTYTDQIIFVKSQIPPSTVGSYIVEPAYTNDNLQYDLSGTNIFRIQKADVIVTLNRDTLTQYYTGRGIGVSASTNIPVSSILMTYSGSPTLPIALGSNYAVTATVDDINYKGSASATLSIIPVPCVINFLNLTNTYTGKPVSMVATTTPAGNPVNLTYNGSTTAPTNVGTYTVDGTVDQVTQQNFYGTGTTNMTIEKLTKPFFITNNTQTFTGSTLTNTARTDPAGLTVTYTYIPSPPVNAGSYAVTGVIQDNNYMGNAVSTLVITKATAPISFTNTKQVFSDKPLYINISTIPANLTTSTQYTVNNIISQTGPVNVGSYPFTTTISDSNYMGANSGTLTITKLSTIVECTELQQVYTGSYISTIVRTLPPGLSVSTFYNGAVTPPSSVGAYSVTATIQDSNYAGFTSNTLYINKLSTSVVLTNLNQNYTGLPLSTSVIVSPANLVVNYNYSSIVGPPINVGKYTVTGTIYDSTFTGVSTSVFTIQKASTPITFYSSSQVFTGLPLKPVVVTTPANLSTYLTYTSNGAPIAAPSSMGMYSTIVSVIDDKNYFGNYGGSAERGFEITKAPGFVTFVSSRIESTYTTSSFQIAALRTSPLNLHVNYLYSSMGYLSSAAPSTVGLYTVIGEIQDLNYMGYGSTILNITKGRGNILFTNRLVPYNGNPQSTMYTTEPIGMTVSTTFFAQSVETANPPTAIGTYIAKGVILDSLYTGVKTAQFDIIKGLADIRLDPVSVEYNGLPQRMLQSTIVPALPVSTVRYSNSEYNSLSPPSTSGVYQVTAEVNNGNYLGTGISQLTIRKKTTLVRLTGLEQVYNGGPLSLRTVTAPPNLKSRFKYKETVGNTYIAAPSSIGVYTVEATIDDKNYEGTQTADLSIVLGPPNTITAYPVNNGAIVVWTPPVLTGGSLITKYSVRSIPPTTSLDDITTTYAKMTGLTNGKPYLFTVTAFAQSGTGIPYQALVTTYSTDIPLNIPRGIVANAAGNIFVLDGNALRKFVGRSSETYGPNNLGLNNPAGIAIDANGTLYIADTGNHVIRKVEGGVASILAGSVGNSGMINGTGVDARFSSPNGVAVDASGTVYIADTGNHRIRRIDTAGIVTTYAGTGVEGHADGTSAKFKAPQGLVVDNVGNLYIADTGNHIIRSIDTAQNTLTLVGTPGQSGYNNASGQLALFSSPKGITINAEGMLFIADTGNNTIRKLNPVEKSVTSFAGYGVAGGEDADGANASFNEPTGICFDAYMNMYVTDTQGPYVRKIVFTPLGSTTPTSTSSSNIPAIPIIISISADPGTGTVTLTWIPPSQVIIPIQNYILEYGIASEDSITIDGTLTSYTVANLLGNTEYTFRLRATNLFGFGENTAPYKVTIERIPVTFSIANTTTYDNDIIYPTISSAPEGPYEVQVTYKDSSNNTISSPSQIGVYAGTVLVNTPTHFGTDSFLFEIKNSRPTAPIRVYAIAGNGQATVRWDAPISNGYSDIDFYTVVSNPDAVSVRTTSGSMRIATVPGLTNGISYTFTIVAHNAQGNGSSERTAPITPIGPPSAPTNIRTTRDSYGVVTLAWSAPLFTNGFPVTLYSIESLPRNNAEALKTVFFVAKDVYEYTFLTGVTAGVEYMFRITTYNNVGVGGSAETSVSVIPNTIPDRPVLSVQPSDRSATVSWTMPINRGLPVLEYTVRVTPSNRILKPGLAARSVFVSDLNNGTAYSFSVYATNAIGDGLVGYTRYTLIPFVPPTTNTSQYSLPKWFTMTGRR